MIGIFEKVDEEWNQATSQQQSETKSVFDLVEK